MLKACRPRPWVIHLAAFLLPLLGLAATWALLGVHPFGELSVLAIDLRNQYISFFAYLRDNLLLGGGSWLYTFSKALGGDMAGFSAYYLLSPFNLFLLFFPTHALTSGVALITLLKIGGCGLSMSLLLNSRRARVASLLFSVPYALMDYNNAYAQNLMWLDGVMLLTLVVWGLSRLQRGKSPLLYILSISMAIITCYYIGYILCLFSVLFFLVSFFFFQAREPHALRMAATYKPLGHYALASLLGGGLSAAVLLPAILSLQGGKASLAFENLTEGRQLLLSDLLSRYLPGTVNMGTIFSGYPHIYCGVLALVCTLLFFLNKRVGRREKLGAALLFAVLILSFSILPLDRVWHGLNKPEGFFYRYSFLLSFCLLSVGYSGFARLRFNTVAKTLPAVAAAIVFVTLLVWRDDYAYVTVGKVAMAFALLAAACVLLWLYSRRKVRHAVLILLVLVLIDMGGNLLMGLRRIEYFPYEYYSVFVKRTQPVVKKITEADRSFYRMESTDAFSDNDAMLFGYRGLSHYSSSDKMAVRDFLDWMGFSKGGNSVKYAGGSTAAAESLLGLKYLLTRGVIPKPYIQIGDESGILSWQNPGALPLGFMAGGGVLQAPPLHDNLFVTHNALWQTLMPAGSPELYRPAASPAVSFVNLNLRDFYGEALYEKQDPAGDAFVEYTLQAESPDQLYMLLTTENVRGADVYVNDVKVQDNYLTGNAHGFVALGSHEAGSQVRVKLAPKGNELLVKDAWFYYEDGALLNGAIESLAAASYQLNYFNDDTFEGVVSNPGKEKTHLLLSIPYSGGWLASLNGQAVKTAPALGALTAIEIPEGTHNLRLQYVPPGLRAGLAVTALCLAATALWLLLRRKKRRAALLAGKEKPLCESLT